MIKYFYNVTWITMVATKTSKTTNFVIIRLFLFLSGTLLESGTDHSLVHLSNSVYGQVDNNIMLNMTESVSTN